MSAAATRRAPHGVNFTQWSSRSELLRLIAILALPVVVTNSLQTLITFTDTRMCSILGAAALAAMSIGRTGMFMVFSVFLGLGVGVIAYVSRLTGAGMPDQARVYATLGLASCGVTGLLLMTVGFLIGKGPIQSMVASGDPTLATAQNALAQQYAWSFLSMLFLGLVFMGVQFAAVSVFEALGRTAFPTMLLVISNIANAIGNWLFIPGPGIEPLRHALHLPALGVAGSALSTDLTQLTAMTVAVVWLYRGQAITFDWSMFAHPLAKVWDMLKVGLPVTLQMCLRSISMLVLLKLITYLPGSVVGQSAMQVGIQVESIAFMPALAFMTAAATLVGQNLGAHRPREARTAVLYCLLGNELFMCTLAAAIWIWPAFFVRLFIGGNVPEVIGPTAGFLKVLALCLPGLGAGQTMLGALRGAGDTLFTIWISLISMYCVRLPLACFLAYSALHAGPPLFAATHIHGLGFGLTGIWWAMTLSVYVEMGITAGRFISGKWAKVKLRYE